jgi:hypothetical protein
MHLEQKRHMIKPGIVFSPLANFEGGKREEYNAHID